MKIKIINCDDPDSWYTHLIGEEFEVEEFNEHRLKVIEAGNYHYFEIFKLDCELVEEPTITHYRRRELSQHFSRRASAVHARCVAVLSSLHLHLCS